MQRKFESDETLAVVDLLRQAESRLARLVTKVDDDASVDELRSILRDIATVHMLVEAPARGDARAAARVHERAVICVDRSDGGRIEGVLLDLSAGGALICCEAHLEKGEKCNLEGPGFEQPVTAVVRAEHQGLTHLAFEGMTLEEKVRITKHLDRHFQRYG